MTKTSEQYRNELEELAMAIYDAPADRVADLRRMPWHRRVVQHPGHASPRSWPRTSKRSRTGPCS